MRPAIAAAFWVALVLTPLIGCTADVGPSAGPDSSAAAAELASDPEPKSASEKYASGELTVGDPADHGYAPVTVLPESRASVASSVSVPDPTSVLESQSPVPAVGQGETLSGIDPIDHTPAPGTLPSVRDDIIRNGLGEPMTLDDAATRACGNAEIAVRSMDSSAPALAAAVEHTTSAATAAADSTVPEIAAWAKRLATAAPTDGDLTMLVGFLRACTAGGYEL